MGNLVKLGMAWGILLGACVLASAEPPTRPDYLILKNGSVLSGRVVQDGTSYVVKSLTSTGESRYPAGMVAKVCGSPQEVYAVLKKCIVEDDAGQRCRLAKFCLQNDLMKEARTEIEEALKIDGRSQDAQLLVRQWQTKQAKPAETSDEVPALPTASVKPIPPVSLDDWPAAMNPTVRQDFSRRIQPMVQSGCGVGACHGVSEGKRAFVLKKSLVGIPPSPVMTQANLERVLALVDAATPDSSELLKRAQQPHGNYKVWPVTPDQLAALRHWVHYMAGKPLDSSKQDMTTANGTDNTSKNNAKGNNDFAVQNDSHGSSTAQKVEPSSKLPTIPGMSGSAIQQTGAIVPAPNTDKPTEPAPPPKQSGGLPPIPGVSGKGQGASGQSTPPPLPGKTSMSDSLIPNNERKPLAIQDQAGYWEYAKRLGLSKSLPDQKQGVPERIQITNAGTFSVSVPPPLEFSEETRLLLKREEDAKAKKPTDPGTGTAGFMQSGTIVNGPR